MKTNRRQFLANTFAGALTATIGNLRVHAAEKSSTRRIFVADFSHETNTFHPQKTTSFSYGQLEADFSLPVWKEAGFSVVRGATAHPNSGGTIEEKACREAMQRILDSLRAAGSVDAAFLRLHGAMYAEGVGPAESVLVTGVRQVLGPRVPIACTFDLHGNIPARLAGDGDILVGLKTAPHTDGAQTAELAAGILRQTLEGKVRPVSYVLPIPLIFQGEKAMTTSEPFRSLVEEARRIEREGVVGHNEKILAATLFVGCAWTDSPDTGMSVVVTADASKAAARAAAIHLAKRIWDARHQFDFGCATAELEEGVTTALAAKETTVFLTDSGDNVTAGTPGDLPLVLRHLVERKVNSAVVAGVNDPAAVARCVEAGEGKTLRLSIGANIEKRFGPPLEVEARVVRLITTGRPKAVVRIGEVEAILNTGSGSFTDPRQFETCGIDPLTRKIVVVKQGYLFPGLTRIAPRYIMLLTPGAGDMRIEKLTYVRRRKPIFPFEPTTAFDAESAPS
jgi:microcystin degradation protein MlrC